MLQPPSSPPGHSSDQPILRRTPYDQALQRLRSRNLAPAEPRSAALKPEPEPEMKILVLGIARPLSRKRHPSAAISYTNILLFDDLQAINGGAAAETNSKIEALLGYNRRESLA